MKSETGFFVSASRVRDVCEPADKLLSDHFRQAPEFDGDSACAFGVSMEGELLALRRNVRRWLAVAKWAQGPMELSHYEIVGLENLSDPDYLPFLFEERKKKRSAHFEKIRSEALHKMNMRMWEAQSLSEKPNARWRGNVIDWAFGFVVLCIGVAGGYELAGHLLR